MDKKHNLVKMLIEQAFDGTASHTEVPYWCKNLNSCSSQSQLPQIAFKILCDQVFDLLKTISVTIVTKFQFQRENNPVFIENLVNKMMSIINTFPHILIPISISLALMVLMLSHYPGFKLLDRQTDG